jgi:uncharacterized membrane protein YwzB
MMIPDVQMNALVFLAILLGVELSGYILGRLEKSDKK